MDREAAARSLLMTGRARHACVRCKRQKLKCDNHRPCYPCMRSGMECKDDDRRDNRRSKTRTSPHKAEHNRERSRTTESERDVTVSLAPSPAPTPAPATAPATAPASSSHGSQLYIERTSTLRVVQQVYREHLGSATASGHLDALPDSPPDRVQSTSRPKNAVPIAELIGVELPPVPIIECLLETYVGTLHWYVTLFHEPTLRARLRGLLASGQANADDFSFLMLIVIILGTGSRYVTAYQMKQHGVEFNAAALEAKYVAAAEQQLLPVLEDPAATAVSFLDLLASHYLFNRKVRRAFVIMGVAMRAAQAMDLHNEPAWGDIPAVEREWRRRLWWTLYTSEKFVAQSYGRPAVIQDIDVEVSFADMDDDSYIPSPVTSKEIFENGTQKPVTASSYHRYKARLYRIAAPITRVMRKARTVGEITHQIRTVHAQMLEFKRVLPVDLRLETYEDTNLDYNKKCLRSILHLQSLALRISYDNIQMLLHRPLISMKDLAKQSTDTSSTTTPGRSSGSGSGGGGGRGGGGAGQQSGDISSEISEDMIAASRRQCWQSALQLSHLSRHRGALEFLKNTPLGAHIGMNCFTAGVMLAIFALSKPFTTQAQEAKQALGRLIRIGTWAQSSIASFNQSTGILKDLLRLIMEKELKALTEPNEHETFSSQPPQQQRRPIGEDVVRGAGADNNSDATRMPTEHSVNSHHHVDAQVALIHHVDAVQQGIQPQPGTFGGGHGNGHQYASDPFGGFVDWYGSSANEGFDAALSSLQNAFLGNASSSVLDLEYPDWQLMLDEPPSPRGTGQIVGDCQDASGNSAGTWNHHEVEQDHQIQLNPPHPQT